MILDSKDSGTVSSEDGDSHHKLHHRRMESRPGSASPDICIDKPGGGIGPSGGYPPLYHPAALHHYRPPTDLKHSPGVSTNSNLNSKPRIWRLADVASKEDKDSSELNHKHYQPPTFPPGFYPPAPGKILSPLPSRVAPYHPYLKHEMTKPEIYRNFNSSIPGHPGMHPDYAILEQYQRALAAQSMHPLSSVISKSMDGSNSSFGPLSLTTNNNNNNNHNNNNNNSSSNNNNNSTSATLPSAGASPSASSTSSSRPENTTPISAIPSTVEQQRSLIENNVAAIATP